LGLFALVRAFRAQWDQSDAAYRTAIALATDADERAVLSLKFGMSLYQRTLRDAALEVLSAIDLERVTAKTRARVLSHLAVHHAQNGETDAADRCAAQALGIMAAADAPARAAALYNIAMASFCLQRPAEGRHRLTEALAIAERGGEAERDIVIRCHHALSFLAFNDGCWDEVRGHLTTMLVNAELSGEVAQVELATGELFRFETLVGDHARLGEFAPRHHLEHPGVGSNVSRTFARSMHAALAGDFENAELRLREELRCEALDVDDRVFVLSHEALWAAAAGNGEAARATLDRAGTAFVEFAAIGGETGPYATQMLMAKVILAIAHTLLAQPCECARLLAEVEQIDSPVPAVRQFAAAARLFNRLAQRAAQRDEVDGAAAKLHALGLGGYADLFAVLPPVNPFGAFARLTKTQMRMVRLIARGGTTHAIAAEIGRSPETVGSHIAAILSKLGCE
ncbi:MAG: helix-turn-helix transcriptional regulator, partial [Vulcanimicrobiaceae bacterium]